MFLAEDNYLYVSFTYCRIARASSANDLIIQVGDSSFHLHKVGLYIYHFILFYFLS